MGLSVRLRLNLSSLAAALLMALPGLAAAQAMDEEALIETMRNSMAQRGQTLSPEQELSMRLKIRETMQRMQQLGQGRAPVQGSALPLASPSPSLFSPPAPLAAPAQAATPQPARATAELAQQIAALPAPHTVQVEQRKDGFVINGQLVVDPEGKVGRAAVDPLTGDFAYLVQRMDGVQLLKRGRGTAAPFTVGQVSSRPGQWMLQTVDGQTLAGDGLVLSSQGALLLRAASAFEFRPGQALRTIAIPEGWTPVPLQRGDVASTRTLLLEKDASTRPSPDSLTGAVSGLFSLAKRVVGAEEANDYALFHLDTGMLSTLAMAVDDKQVTRYSDCRRQNAVVNKCAKADSYESLWNPDGSPNAFHYFWQAQWFNTAGGPVAVVRQASTKEVRLFDLASGKQVVAFRRPMGIAKHTAQLTAEGKLRVTAQLAFTTHTLEDARALLDSASDQRGAPVEGTIIAGQPEGAAPAAVTAGASGS
ncbi:hypothetical protein [Roseateles flavus]|uniref:Uncharacterized protein n=1 Tax=Roseateles flavus TaxID=3149041 RepID=A0ABV0GIU3_9BURK